MKTVAVLFLAFSLTVAAPTHAQKRQTPHAIVGLWQATATVNGTFVHHVINLLPDGTGTEEIYAGRFHAALPIRWMFFQGTLYRYAPDGDIALTSVRFVSRTKISVMHIGGYPIMDGGSFEYNLQEHQNEGGC